MSIDTCVPKRFQLLVEDSWIHGTMNGRQVCDTSFQFRFSTTKVHSFFSTMHVSYKSLRRSTSGKEQFPLDLSSPTCTYDLQFLQGVRRKPIVPIRNSPRHICHTSPERLNTCTFTKKIGVASR